MTLKNLNYHIYRISQWKPSMCLILFANDIHPKYRLILAANRDEFYARPTQQLGWWDDFTGVLAGRDLKNRGTWLGVNQQGGWGGITNFRDPPAVMPDAPSRGHLVSRFLIQSKDPEIYIDSLKRTASLYNGFNLLVGNDTKIGYYSNKSGTCKHIPPGLFGLSNDLLDTPWPKVMRAKRLMAGVLKNPDSIDPESVFKILEDRTFPPDHVLPDTGVGDIWERMLSPIFINGKIYGTRCASVLLVDYEGTTRFYERTFDRIDGEPVPRETVGFVLNRKA